MPPSIGKRLPETSQSGKGASEENGASTPEPIIKRDGEPAADESAAEIRRTVDQSK